MKAPKYKDWKGNEIKAGDTVYLMRVFEVEYRLPFLDIPMPIKSKPCWERLATFRATDYMDGQEKLVRYLRNGYDKETVYEAPINSNDFRHGHNSDLYILCIKGISDNELDYYLHSNNIAQP